MLTVPGRPSSPRCSWVKDLEVVSDTHDRGVRRGHALDIRPRSAAAGMRFRPWTSKLAPFAILAA